MLHEDRLLQVVKKYRPEIAYYEVEKGCSCFHERPYRPGHAQSAALRTVVDHTILLLIYALISTLGHVLFIRTHGGGSIYLGADGMRASSAETGN